MAKSGIDDIEESLNDIFGKKAPKLPESGRDFLVKYGPYFVLAGGIASILSAWSLWDAARRVNYLVDWANELSRTYGGTTVSSGHLTPWVWLAIAFMTVNAVLYLLAFNPLRARQKKGWNYVFYASLLGIAYAVISLFIDGYGVSTFLGSLIGVALSFWVLFQVRPKYLKQPSPKKQPRK